MRAADGAVDKRRLPAIVHFDAEGLARGSFDFLYLVMGRGYGDTAGEALAQLGVSVRREEGARTCVPRRSVRPRSVRV